MAVTTDATIRPDQLETELTNAGIDVSRGVGTSGARTGTIHTYDADGHIVDLPAAAQAVVDSHDPQPVVDPRIAVIDAMDSISDADKAALKSLFPIG